MKRKEENWQRLYLQKENNKQSKGQPGKASGSPWTPTRGHLGKPLELPCSSLKKGSFSFWVHWHCASVATKTTSLSTMSRGLLSQGWKWSLLRRSCKTPMRLTSANFTRICSCLKKGAKICFSRGSRAKTCVKYAQMPGTKKPET